MNKKENQAVIDDRELEYLTPADVMDILKVNKATAYRIFSLPDFPCTRIGKKFIVNRKDFVDFMKSNVGKQL